MKSLKSLLIACTLIAGFTSVAIPTSTAEGAFFRRSYYNSWSYYSGRSYYYRYYYYKPYTSYSGYKHHYAVYYPSRPRYVYYYNPVRRVYWGRYDLEAKGYSMLAEKDRKADLKAIPESAFPKPGKMPAIPESTDGETIPRIEPNDLPGKNKDAPKDIPKD